MSQQESASQIQQNNAQTQQYQQIKGQILKQSKQQEEYQAPRNESDKVQDNVAPEQENNKKQDLKEIFDSFDFDKNGSIELKQIQQIAKKLGQKLSQQQVQKIMFKLDTNGDGRISFLQFKKWWEKGRKGKLEKLVFLQADALKMVKFVTKYFKKAGISLQNKAAPKQFDSHKIGVKFGEQKPNNFIQIKFQNFIKGQKYNDKVKAIKQVLPFFDNNKTNIIVKIQCENSAYAKGNFETIQNQLISKLVQIFGVGFDVQKLFKIYCHAGNKQLLICFTFGQQLDQMALQIQQPLFQICNILGDDFYFDFMAELKLYQSVNSILNSQKNLFSSILEGFAFRIESETNSNVMKKLRKLLESSGQTSFLPFTLFRNINIKFNLKTPEDVNDFFSKLGIKEMLESIPNTKDLLSTVTPFVEQAKNNQHHQPQQFFTYKFSDFLHDNASKNTEIMYLNSVMATCLNITAENASQVHKILFNQI